MVKQKSYKPILLLSVIAEMESESITENKIPLSRNLIHRFNSFYQQVGNEQALEKAFLPYYYLQSDLWQIQWEQGASQNCPSSNKGARKGIKYVIFRPEYYSLLKDQTTRDLIKERLFLKAEEDIKLKDPQKNVSFTPPSNIPDILATNFGNVIPFTQKTQLLSETDSLTLNFAQEKLLQDFLIDRWEKISEFQSRNLQILGGPDIGVEYDTRIAGRIDILAENVKTKDLTVIELKRGISGERHLGQLLRYMGWVRTKLAGNKGVFGLLIASGFNNSIRFAIQQLPTISLMKYELNFQLHSQKFV